MIGLKTAIRIPIIKTFELTTAFKLDELPTKIEVKKLPAIQPRLVNRSKTKILFGGGGTITLTFSIKLSPLFIISILNLFFKFFKLKNLIYYE